MVFWSDTDKTSVFNLSDDKLTVSGTASSSSNMMRANISKSKGKWYWEIKINSASGSAFGFGVANKNLSLTAPATDTNLRIYWATGVKYPTNASYGVSFTSGDIISILLDLDLGTLEFWKNGVSQGIAFTDIALLGNDVFPLIRLFSGTINITTNFGETNFVYTMPQGFAAYVRGNLNKILILSNDKKVKSLKYINNNTPIMTSDTLPYGEVKASSYYSSYYPYKAFDGGIGSAYSGWLSNGTMNHWISYSYPHLVDISKYAIWSVRSGYMPKEFRFEVSNDGVNWTVVDQRIMTLNDWKDNDWNYFDLDKPVKAKSFRLYCVNNNGSSSYISVPEMKLIGEFTHLIELPSISEQNFINYGMDSPIQFDGVFTNKNYILQDGVSKNENGYWTTKLDRKPLSIKFE